MNKCDCLYEGPHQSRASQIIGVTWPMIGTQHPKRYLLAWLTSIVEGNRPGNRTSRPISSAKVAHISYHCQQSYTYRFLTESKLEVQCYIGIRNMADLSRIAGP